MMTESMNDALSILYPPIDREALVKEFIEKFELGDKGPDFWLTLVREETNELAEALANVLKEMADLEYVCAGWIVSGGREMDQETAGNVRALDAYYTLIVPQMLDEVFRRVHESNMSKLGMDGKPVRREDGKVLKGPFYKAPDLMDLI